MSPPEQEILHTYVPCDVWVIMMKKVQIDETKGLIEIYTILPMFVLAGVDGVFVY